MTCGGGVSVVVWRCGPQCVAAELMHSVPLEQYACVEGVMFVGLLVVAECVVDASHDAGSRDGDSGCECGLCFDCASRAAICASAVVADIVESVQAVVEPVVCDPGCQLCGPACDQSHAVVAVPEVVHVCGKSCDRHVLLGQQLF